MTYEVKNTKFCKIIELKNNNKTDILSFDNEWCPIFKSKEFKLNDVTIAKVENLDGTFLIKILKGFEFSQPIKPGTCLSLHNKIRLKNESEIIPTVIKYIKSNQA